jgi:hypothetical protein
MVSATQSNGNGTASSSAPGAGAAASAGAGSRSKRRKAEDGPSGGADEAGGKSERRGAGGAVVFGVGMVKGREEEFADVEVHTKVSARSRGCETGMLDS